MVHSAPAASNDARDTALPAMHRIPGGPFLVVSNHHDPEEAPAHTVRSGIAARGGLEGAKFVRSD
ncbi:hypothetical protein C7401_101223 [Paraburkholderia unamae]|nr:hypothetical protein C7401_101223 [Paraburkholderia unamae]